MTPVTTLYTFIKPIKNILASIQQAGGTSYLVGGSVRDLVLRKPLKDLDVEVHGLTLEQLENVLKHFNHVILVGKQFGVLRIIGHDIDWSLPRKDSSGRKPDVCIDPHMDIAQACRRRDVTMNAMAINLNDLLGQSTLHELNFIDPFNGLEDIKRKQLRAVDPILFLEDPLRFFRVMQFIGRFEMQPDAQLNTICKNMALKDPVTKEPLARERIFEEIKKLLIKSQNPSWGFRWLRELGRLQEIFPELHKTTAIMQRADYHPEGDVFEHTMQSLDAAAQSPYYIATETLSSDAEKFLITLGTLCHDLGKITATDHNLHARGHDEQGVTIAQTFLKRITNDAALTKAICKLVRHHLAPFAFLKEKAGIKAYKRLAAKLAPDVTLRQLGLVALADRQGRNPEKHMPLITTHHEIFKQFLAIAEAAAVAHGPEAPILLGRHLMDVIPPGPKLGNALKEAYNIQIEENIHDIEELRRRILKKLVKIHS